MIIDGWNIDEDEVLEANYGKGTTFRVSDLIRLIISYEREACARIVDKVWGPQHEIAAAIRARGDTWESLGRSFIEHEPDQTYGADE